MLLPKRLLLALLVLVVLATMTFFGYWFGTIKERRLVLKQILTQSNPVREISARYQFIRPLLTYNPSSLVEEVTYPALQSKIAAVIAERKKIDGLLDASVFAINYDTGWRIGIAERDQYSPSSMLKVAIMMEYEKRAENDPSVLLTKYPYTTDIDATAHASSFDTPTVLEVGKSYAVQELMDIMIRESDNGAKSLLLNHTPPGALNKIFSDFGIAAPQNGKEYTISPQDFSLFFRVLFNASYLTRDRSEEALHVLSETTYTDGIVSGVPQHTTIAHKFGENVFVDANHAVTAHELHDCGIVYAHPSPYFLCVMTRGNNKEVLHSTIAQLTSLVHEQFTK